MKSRIDTEPLLAAGTDRRRRWWSGYRRLDHDDITRLATAIVEQVKLRGPFQSVTEFVNRRVEDSELGLQGALQAAITMSGINQDFRSTGVRVRPQAGAYADPEAAKGLTSEGAPAALNQADLLAPLAPFVTVRSDTFRIRAMGEATNEWGHILRMVCEAVVQRTPNYVDSRDLPFTEPANLKPGSINERFGRRFEIVSFRWLAKNEL
ncbi:MAG: hypothetical protein ABGZ37_04290 [Akkermansiaceae bacterium]